MYSKTPVVHPPNNSLPYPQYQHSAVPPPTRCSTTTVIGSGYPLAPHPSTITTTEPSLPSISHLLDSINDNYNHHYNNNINNDGNNNSNSNINHNTNRNINNNINSTGSIYYNDHPPPPQYSSPSNSSYYSNPINKNNVTLVEEFTKHGASKLPIGKTTNEGLHGITKSPRSIKDLDLIRNPIIKKSNNITSNNDNNNGRNRKMKQPWTPKEDEQLKLLVKEIGPGLWATIASKMKKRSGKQVRERWLNHLSPNIKKRPWTKQEDHLILDARLTFGNCWSKIAKLLKGRSDNSVKNRYYTTLRRILNKKGTIDDDDGGKGNGICSNENDRDGGDNDDGNAKKVTVRDDNEKVVQGSD